jgi:hypothetical protein
MSTELLKDILSATGGDVNALPDNMKSTIYEAIILKCGGTVDDLPDRLETTYLKRIAECVSGGGSGGIGSGKHFSYDDVDGAWMDMENWHSSNGQCPNCTCLLSTNTTDEFESVCPACGEAITYNKGMVTLGHSDNGGNGDDGGEDYSHLASVDLQSRSVYVQLTDEAKNAMGDCAGVPCMVRMYCEDTGREYDEQGTTFDPDGYASLEYEDYDGSIGASGYWFYATASFDCGGKIVTIKSNSYYID